MSHKDQSWQVKSTGKNAAILPCPQGEKLALGLDSSKDLSGQIHTGHEVMRCDAQMQMETFAVNGSVHTGSNIKGIAWKFAYWCRVCIGPHVARKRCTTTPLNKGKRMPKILNRG